MLTAMLACEAAPQNIRTPLFFASSGGHSEVVKALLAKGADVQEKDYVSIARAQPSVRRAHARACRTRMATSVGCT
jgi:ankyrin repeat protein